MILAVLLAVVLYNAARSRSLRRFVSASLPNLVKSRGVQAVASGKILVTAFQMLTLLHQTLAFRLQVGLAHLDPRAN